MVSLKPLGLGSVQLSMTRRRKAWLIILGALALTLAAAVLLFTPSEGDRLDALAAGAARAVGDVDAEYKTALNGQPAYHGYVIQGPFDSQVVRARMSNAGCPLLSFDEVRASDWRKERGTQGFGPTYIYLRKDTDQQVLIVDAELVRVTRLWAEVRTRHAAGGVTYCLRRWPGHPWQVVDKKDAYQIVY